MAVSVVFSTLKMLKAVLAAGSLAFVSAAPSTATPSAKAVEEDLERLGRTLERIQAVLADAVERQITDEQVRLWLREIAGLAQDAQGVLDEVEYAELRKRVDEASRGKGDQPAGAAPSNHPQGDPLNESPSLREELVARIRGIRVRSDEIEADRNRLRLGDEEGVRRVSGAPPRPPAAAHVDRSSSCTFGRGCDVHKVVGMLLPSDNEADGDDEGEPISVVAIHGVDGIGKTTLAQLVFEDGRVESHFDLKLWVWASQDFDVTRLTREIVESATEESWDDLDELNSLQEILDKHLAGKRVLLVLDDVWNEIQSYWDALLVSLHRTASGSRVIITTPSAMVARSSGSPPSQQHQLQELAEEASWSLFCHHAFGGQLLAPDTHPRVVEMGKEICRRCGGFPLTLVATAELLRGKPDERWWEEIILAGDAAGDMEDECGGKALSTLQVGYHHLPSHLKQCFAYSAALPRARKFRKDQLVRMWVAQGFVRPTERRTEEEIAGDYFEDLRRRSFFHLQKSDYGRSTTRMFVMHDPIQNLAQSVWEGDCCRGSEELAPGCKISRFHCHSTVMVDKLAALSPCDAAYDPGALRTLILRCGEPDMRPDPLLRALLQRLRYLRVLDLSDNNIAELPPSVGDLKFLRYLGLNKTKVTRLPEEIGGLCCLQTLEMRHCYLLAELPRSLRHLLSLRHLDLHCSTKLSKMPRGIGDLTGVQTLPLFAVGKEEGFAVDEGSRPAGIVELGHLNGLRGELHILGLQNAIYGKTDAERAKMASKEHLEKLHLDWKGEDSFPPDLAAERDQDLLDGLRPHANVRELKISLYKGRSFPSWMGSGAFAGLRRVALIGCGRCASVSPLGRLLALRSLDVRKMDGTRLVGREFFGGGGAAGAGGLFPSLEELGLHFMAEWEEWVCWEEAEAGSDFPCLRRLTLRCCPKLRSLSLHNLKALRALDIGDCEELAWISCSFEEDSSSPSSDGLQEGQRHSCLEKLEIQGCPRLGTSPREQPPSPLHRLHAGGCSLQRKRTRAEAS